MISKHTKKFSTLVQKVDKYIYLFFVLIFIFILAFIVFFKTPMISWIGIAGNNKWVTTEDIIENVFVKENNISTEDYIFKYLISKNKIVELSYDKIINTIVKVDSLSKEVELWKLYATNIRQITTGKKEGLKSETLIDSIRTTKNLTQARSSIDSILRKEVFKEKDIFDKSNFTVEGIKIYPPMDGELTTHFNYSDKISGVTISTVKMTPVISVAEGTIILSMWTPEDGNIISIQHPDNITSTYKGVSQLIKQKGDKVSAEEVIGYIGGSAADYSPSVYNNKYNTKINYNLHFELWHNGNIVNPEKYIIFN